MSYTEERLITTLSLLLLLLHSERIMTGHTSILCDHPSCISVTESEDQSVSNQEEYTGKGSSP